SEFSPIRLRENTVFDVSRPPAYPVGRSPKLKKASTGQNSGFWKLLFQDPTITSPRKWHLSKDAFCIEVKSCWIGSGSETRMEASNCVRVRIDQQTIRRPGRDRSKCILVFEPSAEPGFCLRTELSGCNSRFTYGTNHIDGFNTAIRC